MKIPVISIVLPVFNAEKYILSCLDSILEQTFVDWELIILNDASTDKSHEIILNKIKGYAQKIKYHKLVKNHGVAYCRQMGINYAIGEYIAMMDNDDIMFPNRLNEQILFLENHLDIGIVGSYAMDMDEHGTFIEICTKPTDNKILKQLLFKDCPFIHPSILMRKSILDTISYRSKYPFAEDYDLWIRLADKTNFANLAIPLIYKRMHSNQITASKRGNYDWLKIKWNYYLQTQTLLKNHWYLWRHIFILLTPTPLFLFLKKRKHENRKKTN